MIYHALIETPRWLLLVLLLAAPWAHGSIPAEYRNYLVYGCYGITTLWLITILIRRRMNYFPWIAGIFVLWILVHGWGMAWNARFIYDMEFDKFLPIAQMRPDFPGSIDQSLSSEFMFEVSAFLCVFLMVCDISQNPHWRSRILIAASLSGFSIILLGLFQHLFDFWLLWPKQINVWPFATYFYHGNAGAYMNLVIPLVIGGTFQAFRGKENPMERAFWVTLTAICVTGPFINASKGATPVTLIILFVFFIWQMKRQLFHLSPTHSNVTLISTGAIVLCLMVTLVYAVGPQTAMNRWTHALSSSGQFARGRLVVSQICWDRIVPISGKWGLGPDTFHVAFPFFTMDQGDKLFGFWRYAHEDYLETLIEWGWIGVIPWAILLFGGLFLAYRNYFKYYSTLPSRDRTLLFSVGLAILGICIHAIYDFPLQIPSLQFYLAIYLGLAWGGCRWHEAFPSAHRTQETEGS